MRTWYRSEDARTCLCTDMLLNILPNLSTLSCWTATAAATTLLGSMQDRCVQLQHGWVFIRCSDPTKRRGLTNLLLLLPAQARRRLCLPAAMTPCMMAAAACSDTTRAVRLLPARAAWAAATSSSEALQRLQCLLDDLRTAAAVNINLQLLAVGSADRFAAVSAAGV